MPQQYKSAKRAMKKPAMSHGNKPKMYGKPKMYDKKPNAKFPDLSGDGKVTKKDILMGRGVIDKPKMLKNKRKDVAGKAMMAYAKPAMYGDKPKMYGDKPKMYGKPKGYVSDAQRKAVHASKADGGEGNPNKPKMAHGKKPKSTLKRITVSGHKSKELGLTGASKHKSVRTVEGKSTLTKTKTRLGGAKTTKEKNITNKRAARIAKRYNK